MFMQATMSPPPAAVPVVAAPILLEFFLVQGVGFRCLAYLDPAGCWRDALSNEELVGDIQIAG